MSDDCHVLAPSDFRTGVLQEGGPYMLETLKANALLSGFVGCCHNRGCGAAIVGGQLHFRVEYMERHWVLFCAPCVARRCEEWNLEQLRREKGRIETQEHPSAARLAELNQQIEAAVMALSSPRA